MPEVAAEIVYTGVGKFVKEKIIDPHTPEAHYQDIMQKYFWVTDRLEGPSFELAQRLRPQVELAARAAGWSKTLVEGFIVGQAAAFMMFLGYRGFKSTAEVFGGMARRHGGKVLEEAASVVAETTIVTGAADHLVEEPTSPTVLSPTIQPIHISTARMKGFAQVTQRIRGDGRETRPPPPTKPRSLEAPSLPSKKVVSHHSLSDLERVMMRKIGNQAHIFGEYLKEHLRDISDEQRRHAQRALAHILKNMLSENGNAPLSQSDPKKAFLDALVATMPRGESLSSDSTNRVFEALQQFNTL